MQKKPGKILCVDDEKNVLRSLQRVFLDDDHEILTAQSGEEGLEILAREGGIQLVISDYRMPGMNGVHFLQRVCQEWPETVRIVLSGYADTAAVVDAINEGQIYKFIPKPWDDDELRTTINDALQRYILQQENERLVFELQQSNEEFQLINEKLEKMVHQRTREVFFHHTALVRSQTIMSHLPVAVIGIDPSDMVVLANVRAEEIFNPGGENFLIGSERRCCLPKEVNAFLDRIEEGVCPQETIQVHNTLFRARGTHMATSEQKGIILVLEENA